MSHQWKVFKQRYYGNLNILSLYRPFLLPGNFQSEHVAGVENFKQRYYRNFNTLSVFRPVLLSSNSESEYVAAVEMFQRTIISEP